MSNGRSDSVAVPSPGTPLRDILILAGALLLTQVPFLHQALIIDGGKFVDQALQILRNPAEPYSFAINLRQPIHFFGYFANPPGQAYYLATAIRSAGLSELVLHLACLPFSALALFATHRLASQLTGSGLFPALLLLLSPVFLVSSHTVMPDVSTTAFFVLAVTLFVGGVDRNDPRALIGAGLAAAVATFLKYSAVSLLPLMLFYLLLRKRFSLVTLAPVVIAAAAFAAWCLASYLVYGQVHFIAAAVQESVPRTAFEDFLQVVAAFLGAGAAVVFPPVLVVWAIRGAFVLDRRAGACTAIAAFVGFLVALPAYSSEALVYDLPNRILGGVFLAAGIAAVLFTAICGLRALGELRSAEAAPSDQRLAPEHTLLLVVWFLGFMLMNAGLVFATPKYLLPGIAPLLILLSVSGGGSKAGDAKAARLRAWEKGVILATTAALALVLSFVSAAQGNTHRYVVAQLIPELAEGRTSWFTGHWAIQHYAERVGHRYLSTHPHPTERPETGDLVFVLPDAIYHPVPEDYAERLEIVDQRAFASPFSLLMANQPERAGYWAHLLGMMPYLFSGEPLTSVVIFRVTEPR